MKRTETNFSEILQERIRHVAELKQLIATLMGELDEYLKEHKELEDVVYVISRKTKLDILNDELESYLGKLEETQFMRNTWLDLYLIENKIVELSRKEWEWTDVKNHMKELVKEINDRIGQIGSPELRKARKQELDAILNGDMEEETEE